MKNRITGILIGILITSLLSAACGDGVTGPSETGEWFGWAVGGPDLSGSMVLRTADGGINWERQLSPAFGSVDMSGVCTVDSMCAWVVGFPSDGYGTAVRTIDGGENWQRLGSQGVLPNSSFNSVHALDRSTAWLVGDENTILYTGDAGETWSDLSDPLFNGFGYDDIHVLNSSQLWVVGGNGTSGIILSSIDGGGTWMEQGDTALLDSFPMINVSAVSADTAWVVGHGHTVARTIDGGANWELHVPDSLPRIPRADDANGVVALSSGWVLVTMDFGKVYISEDSGTTWTKQDVPTAELVLGCCALDEQTAWAACEAMNASGGCIIGTRNGGSSWGLQHSTSTGGIGDISFAESRQ